MGFPSPAGDFAESRLSMNTICDINANKRIVETSDGYAVVNVSRRPGQGETVLIRYDGRMEFAKLHGDALITAEGEAIEDEALDDVEVVGVVTHTIIDLMQDELPV
ncbi:hypothetical protein ACOI9Q_19440 [Klebsiella sp. C228]|uniref:hypothetical protein n=1 Tax=Klebsiella TaxID=570 RepID=UPI0020CB85F0|nr:hypothetical protein [Klebsiella pneumoniae]MCQ0659068.1 hypothetical protein [Klebsiella pneumoniae]MDZ1607090.1 hypothetical protein [Klebsiella pneumoniae]HBT3702482.1 hypothetical protein [Klebsiella pneumoniae]HCT9786812.1 hypothetical protein [Klebsiella pneumoniae]